jgi:hypothetical protein
MTTTAVRDALDLSPDDYQKATVEVAFLLDAFASTIDNIMGGNTAPVGRVAGRDTARKLPIHLPSPTLPDVVAAVSAQMHAGFDFALDGEDLVFQSCILRDMCAVRGIATDGPLCHLFHSYLDGVIDGLLCRPVQSTSTSVGEHCRWHVRVQ